MITLLEPPADIFASRATAIVIPTNTLGVQGKGLALAAAKRWPEWNRAYRAWCTSRDVLPGSVWASITLPDADGWSPMILALATKEHWRRPSRLEWIRTGVVDLIAACRDMDLSSVAVPALGCGYGELEWTAVWAVMHAELKRAPTIDFRVYAPQPLRKEPRKDRR